MRPPSRQGQGMRSAVVSATTGRMPLERLSTNIPMNTGNVNYRGGNTKNVVTGTARTMGYSRKWGVIQTSLSTLSLAAFPAACVANLLPIFIVRLGIFPWFSRLVVDRSFYSLRMKPRKIAIMFDAYFSLKHPNLWPKFLWSWNIPDEVVSMLLATKIIHNLEFLSARVYPIQAGCLVSQSNFSPLPFVIPVVRDLRWPSAGCISSGFKFVSRRIFCG